MSESEVLREEGIKWHSFLTIGLSVVAVAMSCTALYFQYKTPSYATISIVKIIDSQVKKIDDEMISTKSIPSEAKIKADVDKYTQRISETLVDYSKKNNLIIFEKGSIVSSGQEIKDITDKFIKAISE